MARYCQLFGQLLWKIARPHFRMFHQCTCLKLMLLTGGLFDCGAQEQLIDERCFMYGVDSIFNNAEAQCDKLSRKYKYELHKIVNTFEQKWISSRFFKAYFS